MTLISIPSLIGLGAGTLGLARSMLERPRTGTHPLVDLIRDRFSGTHRHFLLGAIAGVVGIVAPLGLAMSRGWARCELVEEWSAIYPLLVLLTLAAKFFWAAAEELMFRGGLLPQISRRLGPLAGLVISAALFSMAHLERTGSRTPDLTTLAVLFLDGIGFGVAYLATRSLWLPSIWHSAKNITIWLLYSESALQFAPGLARVTFLGPRVWVGSASQAGRFDLIVTAVLTGLMLVLFRRPLRDLEWVKTA